MSESGLYLKAQLCAGIFGAADCGLGTAVEPVLLAHMAASPNFRGIRSAFPPDLNATWQEGFAMLGKHDLTFDNYSPDWTRLPTLAKQAKIKDSKIEEEWSDRRTDGQGGGAM